MFNPPRKSLGQNFLNDENIQRKIVNLIDTDSSYTRIIEIGPGRGALTKHLIALKKPLTLIEYDKDLAAFWKNESIANVDVIRDDILNVDFKKHFKDDRLIVIGNIPYNITSPILFKLIENKSLILQSILMMQKEVAQRIVSDANSKDYGILSIMHQLHAKSKISFNVSRNVFYPKPKVDSSVISSVYLNEFPYKIENIDLFKHIVRQSFQQRRKMIRSSLKAYIKDIDPEHLSPYLELRPENLALKDFSILANKIMQFKMQL